jgi:putative hemolysin
MQSFSDIVAALQDSSCGTQGGREEKQGDADSSDGDTSTPDGRKVGFA